MAEKKSVKIDKFDDEKFAKSDVRAEKVLGRDVIYIDTDDDITSVIEKVKNSRNSVIALVPPARAGVLQSVVNLKLLTRAAKNSRKKLTLVTSDKALLSLAAGLKIPVAKNLNAQAEIPVSRNDSAKKDENEIDGNDFAVGELAALGAENADENFAKKPNLARENAAVEAIETDDEIRGDEEDLAPNDDEPENREREKRKPAKNKKIPNFSAFRKKLLIFGGLAVILIGFLVWAIIFAPHGTITVTAKTSAQAVSANVSLTPGVETNIGDLAIQPLVKTTSKTETANFAATGSQMVGGTKATGTISLTNHSSSKYDPDTGKTNEINLPAGATISVNGQQFTINSAVTVVGGGGTNTVDVTAVNFGSAYNAAANSPVKVAGYDQATQLDGAAKGAFSGGADQTKQTVVQQSDLDAAIEKLKNQGNQDEIKKQLQAQFGSGIVVIAQSFSVNNGNPSSSPAVGSPVSGNSSPAASITITYTMVGISEKDLNAFLDAQINNSLSDKQGQKIYNNGLKNVKFANFQASGKNYSVTITTTGQVGPSIDSDQLKTLVLGKKSGEIQSELQSKFGDNIENIKVDFSPFWINSISDKSKLTVDFAVNE